MSDKIKLKTREPNSAFLEDTKPTFIPRVKSRKARAWYNPQDNEEQSEEPVAAPPTAEPSVPAVEAQAAVLEPVASRQVSSSTPMPSRVKPVVRSGATTSFAEASAKPFESKSATDKGDAADGAEAKEIKAPLTEYSERVKNLISRARSKVSHENLFRQIVLFEMSEIDESQRFGILKLSNSGLEQIFNLSETATRRLKRDMEAANLIVTEIVGSRNSPTVYRVHSPYCAQN